MSKDKTMKRRSSKRDVANALQGLFQANPGEAMTLRQIFKALRLNTHPLKMLAIDALDEMTWDDYVVKTQDGAYRLNLKTQVQEGTFVRKANGKNSFIPDGGGEPIFVSERNSMMAMGGDRVRVAMMARRPNHMREAVVTEIIERKHEQAVGILQVEKDYAFLNADGSQLAQDILIPKKKLKGGKTGQKAVVRITQWPSAESKNLVGEVIDVLGEQGDNNVEMHAILAKYGLPYKYPKKVEEAANKINADITPADLEGREDFRDVLTFTIDPKDAKDFDDALSIAPLKAPLPASPEGEEYIALPSTKLSAPPLGGAGRGALYEVGVHIADVSHYVTEGSVIDKEAQQRATSVYLVDRTIPMLPERLCNFICSLRPDEEKLCYSVVFVLDEDANIKSSRLVHTVIRSDRRFAYEEVDEILSEKGKVKSEKFAAAVPSDDSVAAANSSLFTLHSSLRVLSRMAQALRERRFKSGAVKFDREELHFDIDEKGHPTRCYYKKSTLATQLIEEFMLLANRTVAEMIGRVPKGTKAKTLPYRIHDQPDPQKLEQLRTVVAPFGYKLKVEGSRGAISKSLNKLIADADGHREQKLVETLALRAMMKAKYSTHNIGHYGLAFDYYTHFTSPIRRYPDTMVHRLLTRYQEGGRSANQKYYEEQCEHSSLMEQTAQQAERDSIKYKMVEFMGDKIGQEFDAHISGIQSYGLYCEIDENHCEGLIGMHDLDGDYYEFDERRYCLVGRRTHRKYLLGDPIRIRVARADLERRQLDFELAD
ncbi:MAG: ribonuclease R [Prevotella sp.]|nr:ribonuclease R [Prevotella sp.]